MTSPQIYGRKFHPKGGARTFFINFQLLKIYSVHSFSPARQGSKIVLNESSKSTENALIEWLQKDITKYFLKSKVYVVFGNKFSFQNWFWKIPNTVLETRLKIQETTYAFIYASYLLIHGISRWEHYSSIRKSAGNSQNLAQISIQQQCIV
jgi:hypothetical protein